jgi:hypothetical protein
MYSWIVGAVLFFLKPPMHLEFPLVHMVNFFIYVGTFLSFEYFWRQLGGYQQTITIRGNGNGQIILPQWSWWSLGYLLFIWSSLSMINIWSVTPDMLMAALVYLATGLIVRIRRGNVDWKTFFFLGLILGLGYLTETIMLSIAILVLIIALIAQRDFRRAFPRILISFLIFLLISVPFIFLISQAKGKLTWGEAAPLTYARYVNGISYPHWQGEPQGNGKPLHPSRKIFDMPPIYEFGSPVAGTYPISYDPSYWYDGVVTNFDLGQQVNRLISSGLFYVDIFFKQQGALLVSVLLLYMLGKWKRLQLKEILNHWGLTTLAVVVFCLYALVLVAGRYIGVFVVLFWADLLANVRLPKSESYEKVVKYTSILMVVFLLVIIVLFNFEGYLTLNTGTTSNQSVQQLSKPPSWPGQVAAELLKFDIRSGDRVAVIGYAFDSYWARLARVKIVAELISSDSAPFYYGDPEIQSKVIEAFASTGARAIVAENVPDNVSLDGWHQVGDTNYYIHLLDEQGRFSSGRR